jgi:hypothetical protein
MRRKWITPAELDAMLKDPAYQEMRRAKDAAHAKLVEQRRLEQQPLLKDLAAVGVVVDSVGRLCSFSDPDERIYPVLLDHLTRPYSPHLLEWIGRAFGRKSARPIVWDTLVKLIKSHSLEKSAVEGVMVAISDMAQPRDLATLIDLLSDRSIGTSRIFLVSNLMRSKKPEAREALLRNRDDPDLAKEIMARFARSRRWRFPPNADIAAITAGAALRRRSFPDPLRPRGSG